MMNFFEIPCWVPGLLKYYYISIAKALYDTWYICLGSYIETTLTKGI